VFPALSPNKVQPAKRKNLFMPKWWRNLVLDKTPSAAKALSGLSDGATEANPSAPEERF